MSPKFITGLKQALTSTVTSRIGQKPPMGRYISEAASDAPLSTISAACLFPVLSTTTPATGIVTIRTQSDTDRTTPISAAVSPLLSSQSGQNGSWMPMTRK